MRKSLLFIVLTAALGAPPANDTALRLEKSVAVLRSLTSSGDGIQSEILAAMDCIAVVPGFKKGAAVVGIGFGKGTHLLPDFGWLVGTGFHYAPNDERGRRGRR